MVSNFVATGQLDGFKFELYDTKTIVSEIAVVPNFNENRNPQIGWLSRDGQSGCNFLNKSLVGRTQ